MVKTWSFLLLCLLAIMLSACNNQKKSALLAAKSNVKAVIPFEISEGNNIIFKTVLNGKDTLDLFFDTGSTDIILRHAAVQTETTTLMETTESYNRADFEQFGNANTLTLENLFFDSLRVFPVGVGPEDAAGHFGWDIFKGAIVELNYDQKQLILYENMPVNLKSYVKLPLEFIKTLFCIQGNITVNDQSFSGRYLFDSGFQKALLLDKEINLKTNFPDSLPVIKESKLRNSRGDVFINKIVSVDAICFGAICAQNVPTHLLDLPNPASFETHILGNDLLKRFNTIFDFKSGFIYMKPNSLMGLPYADASANHHSE
jgi:hypothetical protein